MVRRQKRFLRQTERLKLQSKSRKHGWKKNIARTICFDSRHRRLCRVSRQSFSIRMFRKLGGKRSRSHHLPLIRMLKVRKRKFLSNRQFRMFLKGGEEANFKDLAVQSRKLCNWQQCQVALWTICIVLSGSMPKRWFGCNQQQSQGLKNGLTFLSNQDMC